MRWWQKAAQAPDAPCVGNMATTNSVFFLDYTIDIAENPAQLAQEPTPP
jgi:hypothetical protein